MQAGVQRGPWATEAVDVVRAVSGGLLFGIPLLYTMEVWWLGSSTRPGHLVAVLGLALAVVTVLNRTSGFRSTRDTRLADAAKDAVEAVALSMLSVLVVLAVLQEVDLDTPLGQLLGKVVYESVAFSIGTAVAQQFLHKGRGGNLARDIAADDGGGGRTRHGAAEDEGGDDGDGPTIGATLADIGAAAVGAVFVAFNIAPTDEVPLVATRLGPVALLAIVALSLATSFSIVFVAGFSDEQKRHEQRGVLQHPVTETVAAYLVSLLCAAAMLWFFQRHGPDRPWEALLRETLVLGLPASVGGAAGRLAV